MMSTLDGKAANSTEAMLLHQNQMLTVENLDLKENTDELSSQCEKYKKTIKAMAKWQATGGRGSEGGAATAAAGQGDDEAAAADESGPEAAAVANRSPMGAGVVGANVLRKETEFKGMFSYPRDSEPILIKNLILELKPKISGILLPGLPAYVLFMCIRHTGKSAHFGCYYHFWLFSVWLLYNIHLPT